MLILSTKLKFLIPLMGVAFGLLGCSAVNSETPSEQNGVSAANVIEITCGLKTLEVQIDALTPEQKEEVEQLKTRCRIDNVAYMLEHKTSRAFEALGDGPNTKHEPGLIPSDRK